MCNTTTTSNNNNITTETRNRSSGGQRRVGLRQIDGIAFGRRLSGTGARGQTAFDAVEEKLVVVVVVPVVQVAKSGGCRGHGVRGLLYFVDGRKHRLLAGFHQATTLPHEVTAPEKFLGGGLCAQEEKKNNRKNRESQLSLHRLCIV